MMPELDQNNDGTALNPKRCSLQGHYGIGR